jgi:peptidoglycan/LPS O-acetylase OafA/YrhL
MSAPPFDAPGVGRRLPSLTSLRWLAATLVFLRHGQPLIGNADIRETYDTIADQGSCGVSFFFVLSGFVLAWSHRPGDTVAQFYRRRVARIVPAYWTACLIAIPITYWLARPTTGEETAGVFLPFTLLQSWVPRQDIYFGGNGVSWSLSTEIFFYVLFPLLVVGVLALAPRRRVVLLVALAVAGVAGPLIVHTDQVSGGTLFWLTYINPGWRLVEFALGMALASLLRAGRRAPIGPRTAIAIAIAAYVAAGWAPPYAHLVAITLVPFALVIWACAGADLDRSGPRWLRSRSLIRLGQWSFAFYLVHQMVINTFVKHGIDGQVPTDGERVALVVVSYLIGIAVAAALFHAVEQPLERRIRHGGTATPRTELALGTT